MPPPGAGLHRIRARTRITLALLLYGLVLSVWGAARFNAAIPDSAVLMRTRIEGVRYSLQTLKEGGPPPLACKRGYTPGTKSTCGPARWTDDQGLYLLVVTPAVALGAVPPLLTLPHLGYQMSWLGAWAFLWLLAAGWPLTTVPRDILRRLETRRPPGPAEEPPSCGDPARRKPSRAGCRPSDCAGLADARHVGGNVYNFARSSLP